METSTLLRFLPEELEGANRNTRKEKDEATTLRPHMIPALYTTPESTPEVPPDYPSSFPPLSPYIVNHKSRGKRPIAKSFSQNDVRRVDPSDTILGGGRLRYKNDDFTAAVAEEELELELGDFYHDDRNSTNADVGTDEKGVDIIGEGLRLPNPESTPLGEFYDAFEEISADGSKSRSLSNRKIETEIRNTRLNLLMEIERRKQAEDSIRNLNTKWNQMSDKIPIVGGLTLPALETDDEDRFTEFLKQFTIARFVGRCIRKAFTRDDFEAYNVDSGVSEIELKNSEIARLWDRLKYYEAANHEMSKRNQETIKLERQRRIKRKRRQKWVWSSVGVAVVVIGTATVTLYYLRTPATSQCKNQTLINGLLTH